MTDKYSPAGPARRPLVATAAAAASALLLAGCTSSSGQSEAAAAGATAGMLPSSHIHGVAIDPADGRLLLATHDGLFDVGDDGESTHIGPVIDLMGFAVRGPGHFLASGHPGPDADLPEPVGLIESTDGGRTWEPRSRQGESDFHALTVSDAGILGYDGSLVRSADGEEWEQLLIPAAPAALAAAPDGRTILATTEQGLLSSLDGGRSWVRNDGAPLLQVVDWADDGMNVAGVDSSGAVWTSADAARTWQAGPKLESPPQAVAATSSVGASLRITVVTTTALVESDDGGLTFEVVLED
ncbi:F510_1955 family glycosylhydrolase [Geodermatophilus marinus]|uniref:F510_1955 family glycosylhydrolase n=1 Tax=Geodermatophilus sp. LHW52908 TaxID=2303986 RepID=UPI001F43B5FD|nr:exo-alpha-sialidase [Geodermatophilus sp. LHW52908]